MDSWNLQSLLLRASQTPAAPTAKARPEARLRFPYIEGEGGRINFKSGMEKKVYALSEADFALWLASENEWNLRLRARPMRTRCQSQRYRDGRGQRSLRPGGPPGRDALAPAPLAARSATGTAHTPGLRPRPRLARLGEPGGGPHRHASGPEAQRGRDRSTIFAATTSSSRTLCGWRRTAPPSTAGRRRNSPTSTAAPAGR